MSESQASVRLQDHFESLTDPRRGEPVHPLINIVVISVCGVICGAEDFVAIAEFGRRKRKWLETFLDLSSGIPSHDRFNYILARIRPEDFERCLLSWMSALHQVTGGQVIAIDGKTLRRSYDRGSARAAIHMVSAWASENHISLGQVVTNEKSNEITAIPELLKMLEISGSLVTIDAMGCQTAIAKQIVLQDADYVLAVKANQPTLYDGIVAHFEQHLSDDESYTVRNCHHTSEKAHGRETDRSYYVCSVPNSLPDRDRWHGLKAIGMTINTTRRDGLETVEARYYILSRKLTAKQFGAAVRGHWTVENCLHWQLDVTFNEDQCRLRKGHAATNFSLLRRHALSLLKNEKTAKVGVKNKRLAAALDEHYLLKVLTAS